MSGHAPTSEQARAIGSQRRATLVEAGAGTGKTGVMVKRYCELVCDQGVSPDEILAFTFTEKAAAELRQRIRATIEERARNGSARAAEVLPGLGSAWVMTIHGFCNRLLAGRPVAAGIDPQFRVLDAAESERAAAEAFEFAIEEFLADGQPAREELVATYDIAGLRSLITGIHSELRSRGVTRPRLPEPPHPDVDSALRQTHGIATEVLAEMKPKDRNRGLIERAVETLGAGEPPDLETVASLCTTSKAKGLAEYRKAVEQLLAWTAETGEGGVAYREMGALLEIFDTRFAASKERRTGVDFEDLQILAVRVLERLEDGAAYKDRFRHLLVDEFQDTNRLQLRLIEALRGPRTQLMVVGDELQSIYGFRHADLDVFREQRRLIGAADDGEVLALSGNFRSRPEVIGAVNTLGAALIGAEFQPLRVGAAPAQPEPSGGGEAVELLLTGRDGWDEPGIELDPATDSRTPANTLAEARFLAARLRELTEAGVERGQMVVLLRAFTHLDACEDALERAGLRPYVVGGRGYWSQQQVADVCALLAVLANPLDDEALFGVLASPACGVSPDTLWLLRKAAGSRKHIWSVVEHLAGLREGEVADPAALAAIPTDEVDSVAELATTLRALRRRAPFLSLAGLIDAAVTETRYDLAILMRPSGEARFANVRKLMRLAEEFEAGEGRDLRGLLDFLAARADADVDAQAATAVEGHDGVRIMTIHAAKGLEFDVVAVPYLARGLLTGSRIPPLALGHEPEHPRVGMQLRRLGASAINLFSYRDLHEEAKERDAAEELRLFHVAATRARQRLILSGLVAPKAPSEDSVGQSVVERIVCGFDLDREADSAIAIPAPAAREDLDLEFGPSRINVRLNLAGPEQATELSRRHRDEGDAAEIGEGRAPLVERRPPPVPNSALSYTKLSELEKSAAVVAVPPAAPATGQAASASEEDGTARGIAVHELLEWGQANEWRQPPSELTERLCGRAAKSALDSDDLLGLYRAWTDSAFFAERIAAARTRAEVPFLMQLAGAPLQGSIDLLVSGAGTPLIVDYKTDRIGATEPAEAAARYEIQRDLYALAVSEALSAEVVEVAYVFLERPDAPVVTTMGGEEIAAARLRLEARIAAARAEAGTGAGTEPAAAPDATPDPDPEPSALG